MVKKTAVLAQNVISNILSNFCDYQITHVVESSDWAIKNVGTSIARSLCDQRLANSRTSASCFGLRGQIVHFDSVNTFIKRRTIKKPHSSNKIVLTWFHVVPEDNRCEMIRAMQQNITALHTSCETTKTALVQAGFEKEKIVVIPLGVDTNKFHAVSQMERESIRKKLGIPEDRFVIGSFQKDGEGWGKGLEPKLIKGPDVFVQVIERLGRIRPFILLTGPARGYIKNELKKRNIDYFHIYPKKFDEITAIYRALDLYLITSRIEGGPLSLLESWASGVPVVSTRVGMVPDIALNERNALLADSEDVIMLAQQVVRLAQDRELKDRIATHALQDVKNFSWDKITARYYHEIYRPIL